MRRSVLAPLALFTLLRLPSFFEPHWYTDEAGYTTTAQGLLHGKTLYADIWNNKPPLHLWTVAATVRLFGPTEWGLHLLTFASGLAVLLAVIWAAPRLLPRSRATMAVFLAAGGLGLPILDAELAVPESLLIAPATWAALLTIVRLRRRTEGEEPGGWWWAAGVGLLAALAMAYQQTALADATLVGLVLFVAPVFRWRERLAYAVGAAIPTAGWVAVMAALAGPRTVAFALAGFYVPYTQSVLPQHRGGLLLYAAGLGLAMALLAAGMLLMRRRGYAWALWSWSVATLLVPAAAQQVYPHFLLPALIPLTLSVLTLPWPPLPAVRHMVRGAVALGGAVVIAAVMARGAGLDWVPHLANPAYNGYRNLATYYGEPIVSLATTGSLDHWQDQFDERVPADREVVAFLKSRHLEGTRAVVWSSDAWIYAGADLQVALPTGPIYNNFVLLGQTGQVSRRVRELSPDVIVASVHELHAFPEIADVLADEYQPVYSAGQDSVWLRKGFAFPG